MMAPTLGPAMGGWITENYSWPWIFLINVGPGLMVAVISGLLLPMEPFNWSRLRNVDMVALPLTAISLTSLMVMLKDGPRLGWGSAWVLGLMGMSLLTGAAAIWRCLRCPYPLIELRCFQTPIFSIRRVL